MMKTTSRGSRVLVSWLPSHSWLILYLHPGHCGRLWRFGIREAECEEEEEEAQRAPGQKKNLKEKVRGSLLEGPGLSRKERIQTLQGGSASERMKLREGKQRDDEETEG